MMVRVELEPAVKLSREIIEELQDSNKELQDSNKELHREMEDACRRLIEKSKKEEKSEEEIVADLMAVFALSREKAMEKMNHRQK